MRSSGVDGVAGRLPIGLRTESSRLMGPPMTQGALIRSWCSAAMNVLVFQWSKGACLKTRSSFVFED